MLYGSTILGLFYSCHWLVTPDEFRLRSLLVTLARQHRAVTIEPSRSGTWNEELVRLKNKIHSFDHNCCMVIVIVVVEVVYAVVLQASAHSSPVPVVLMSWRATVVRWWVVTSIARWGFVITAVAAQSTKSSSTPRWRHSTSQQVLKMVPLQKNTFFFCF